MKIYNPFRYFTKFEWGLWIISLLVVTLSFFVGRGNGVLPLLTSLLGVTSLILIAKGDVTGQILVFIFSILYAAVAWKERYYGEMITYLLMSAPAAVFSIVSWLRNPYATDRSEVKMEKMHARDLSIAVLLTVSVTFAFYWILRALGNAELGVSTLSVSTSFLASYLLFRRSPFYALAYAANDVVLIVLWWIVSVKDLSGLSMVACFTMFLCNDLYGFFNWLRVRNRQMDKR